MSRRIVILGAAESGVGAAILAQKKGFDVFVSDNGKILDKYKKQLKEHNIIFEEGQHSESLIVGKDVLEVIKSPGIPEKSEIVKKIRRQNISVISEIEFAGRYSKAKMIGITGTNGKTTTTLLTHHILKKAGLNVGLAGNIGNSLALQVAEKGHDYYVIELSSFQLDGMFDFKCDIAVLTNITPDHLDRYEYSIENYAMSKFRITQNQTAEDAFIWCADDVIASQYIGQVPINSQQYPYSIKKNSQKELGL